MPPASQQAILDSIRRSLARSEARLYFRRLPLRYPVVRTNDQTLMYSFAAFRQALNYANSLNYATWLSLRTRGELDHPPPVVFQVGHAN